MITGPSMNFFMNLISLDEIFSIKNSELNHYFPKMDRRSLMNLHNLFHTDSHLRNNMSCNLISHKMNRYCISSFPLSGFSSIFLNQPKISLSLTCTYLIYFRYLINLSDKYVIRRCNRETPILFLLQRVTNMHSYFR